MQKLQSEHDDSVMYTRVACQLLDTETCRCSDYPNRKKKVPECIELTSQNLATFNWLPATCAYQRLHSGKDLPEWHPLVSGDSDSVHRAGISMRGQCVSEDWVHVDDFGRMIIEFDDDGDFGATNDGDLTD